MMIVAPRGFIVVTSVNVLGESAVAARGESLQVMLPVAKIATCSEVTKANIPGVKSMIVLDVREAQPIFTEEDLAQIAILFDKARG